MTPPTHPLIDLLGQVIGTVPTLRLLALFGARRLYVPETIPEDHPIARCLGAEAAHKLARQFGREQLDLPDGDEFARLRRVRRVAGLLRHGTPPRDVAMLIGISTKQVGRYRAEAEELGLLPAAFERPECPEHPERPEVEQFGLLFERPARTGDPEDIRPLPPP